MIKNKSSAQITSLDENGNRLYIHPAEVQGVYRKWRTVVQTFLIIIFLVTPWTKINGLQTILLDIPNREFYFFGNLFRAHNVPLLFFLIFGGAISLAFVTSVWGRVWCGWTCPQTVFIDGVYRRIEYWIEGNYLARRKMQTDPMSLNWIFKKTLKWFSFFIVSSFIAHSILAYFVGARSFLGMIENGPSENMTIFAFAQVFTLALLFDFGWLREQFCTIVCPYGRIQGLLLDKNSLGVVYDEKRNDDCVKCNRCVSACPIGIDIRNGLQMECIQCTACIDACDEIMEKVKKPKGLVRYDTLDGKKINYFKFRSLGYLIIILICFGSLAFILTHKMHSEAFFLRAKDEPFKISHLENGNKEIINHFKLHITNQDSSEHRYQVRLENRDGYELIIPDQFIDLKPKEFKEVHIFIKQNINFYKHKNKFKVFLEDSLQPEQFKKEFEMEFSGPIGEIK